MTPDRLEAIRRLAEARKAADLATLEKLLRAERDCVAEIEAIRATRAAELAEPFGARPPGALEARLRWADQRMAEVSHHLTELGERIRAARAAAAVSLGKDKALGELRDRAAREAARLRLARAERETPPGEGRRGDLG